MARVCVSYCPLWSAGPHTQFSEEELAQLQSGAWENPAFENMDQLMDERYVHVFAHD